MERGNQDLGSYLRRYVSWKQDDWARALSVVDFTANAAPSAATGISPFHAVYEYEPRINFDIPAGEPDTPVNDPSKRHARHQAEALAKSLKETWGYQREVIHTSQEWVSSRENEKRRGPTLVAGDLPYLDTTHLSRGRPTPKLDCRWTGPHKV